MAIDTYEKRVNVVGVGRPWMRSKLPDSAKDEAWRMSTGNTYGGNALNDTAPSLVVTPYYYHILLAGGE